MSSLFKQLSLLGILITLTACSTRYPNQTPLDEAFPAVQGTTLSKQPVSLPMHFSGRPVVLLIGYVQDAQFDIDRWLIGLDMTQTRTQVFELPTIAGMLPRMFETRINDGMRAGIPKSLWGGVITIFDGGERVQQFTGNINPNNARVILLDSQGQVRFFYDEGFAVTPLNALRQALAELSSSGGH